MTLETPAFRYISHQHFHQQASFLQRSSQPQLCSEGRTRSPGSSSKSVTGALCCHRGFSSESCVRFVWLCVVLRLLTLLWSLRWCLCHLATYATRLWLIRSALIFTLIKECALHKHLNLNTSSFDVVAYWNMLDPNNKVISNQLQCTIYCYAIFGISHY